MTIRKVPTLDGSDLILDKFMPARLASGAVAPLVASRVPDANLPARLGASELTATFAKRRTAIERLAVKLRDGSAVRVASAGDSTTDETAEWYSRTWLDWAAARPWMTLSYKAWDDTSQAFLVATTPQVGTVQSVTVRPASDSFNRTAADIAGTSAPRASGVWGGASGDFSLNGSAAVWTASNGFSVLPGAAVAGKKTISGSMTINVGTSAALRRINLGTYSYNTGIERISLSVTISTAGAVTWTVEGQFPGWANIVTGGGTPLIAGVQTVAWSLSIDGTAVSATLNGVTASGTLTAPQKTSVDGMSGVYILPEGDLAGLILQDIAYDVAAPATVTPVLTVINGARAGSVLTYQQTRLAAMYAGPTIDALFISSSHNYGATTPADYLTAVSAFIAAYLAVQPDSAIIVVAQNPQTPPQTAASIAAQRARCVALGQFAKDNGYGFIDALTAFEARSDLGSRMIRTDGVHPTAASTYDDLTDPNNGQFVWKTAALAWLAGIV